MQRNKLKMLPDDFNDMHSLRRLNLDENLIQVRRESDPKPGSQREPDPQPRREPDHEP
jgi:hypothetical protein